MLATGGNKLNEITGGLWGRDFLARQSTVSADWLACGGSPS